MGPVRIGLSFDCPIPSPCVLQKAVRPDVVLQAIVNVTARVPHLKTVPLAWRPRSYWQGCITARILTLHTYHLCRVMPWRARPHIACMDRAPHRPTHVIHHSFNTYCSTRRLVQSYLPYLLSLSFTPLRVVGNVTSTSQFALFFAHTVVFPVNLPETKVCEVCTELYHKLVRGPCGGSAALWF